MLCVMKRLHLESEEKAKLEGKHAAQINGKERDRLKAILLRSEGWTVPQISQALRLHQTTIIRHIEEYKKGKLSNESGGSTGHLSEAQTQELIEHLEANLYHHNHEIILYVKTRWGVSYTVPGMHKWLHRNGFSYKQPKGRPHKADPELQQQFVAEYEQLKKEVGSNEPILFMDSVHPKPQNWLTGGSELAKQNMLEQRPVVQD